jgi:hypothetical protein
LAVRYSLFAFRKKDVRLELFLTLLDQAQQPRPQIKDSPMKIQWTSRQLRLRISATELERLQEGQEISELLDFPGGYWAISLEGLPSGSGHTVLTLEEDTLVFYLSQKDLERLKKPLEEGIYCSTQVRGLRGESRLEFFVEKDRHPF